MVLLQLIIFTPLGTLQAKRELQINHTHCVRPAYQNVCYSEASVWSLLACFFFCSVANVQSELKRAVQLISGAFEHSVLHVQKIYALENVVFCIAVYGSYKR